MDRRGAESPGDPILEPGVVPDSLPALHIRLFGGFELRLNGSPRPLESARAESLLAYLLLHRWTAHPRQHLAFLLWPDSTEPQARTNLRHVLHNLRRAVPPLDHFLEVSPRALRWRAAAPFSLDVSAFEEAMGRAERAEDDDNQVHALREAVELYAGDLLEGSYDEWVQQPREALRQRYLAALEGLSSILAAHDEHAQAIHYAEQLLRLNPLHEQTYRLLMRLHDAQGDRARALHTYHACASALERELGVEPSRETRNAYEALLTTEVELSGAAQPPTRATRPPFVGRAAERAALIALWHETERGRARFVLVHGEAGIGKSRLVEELRSWCAHRGALTAHARGYQAEGRLAYGPVVAWLRAEPLQAGLQHLDDTLLTELARLLPELADKLGGRPEAGGLDQGDQRQRLFDALAAAISTSGAPVLLVLDDLQWCDRETLQLLHYLLRAEPEAPVLVAGTARREEIEPEHPLNDLVTGLQALDRFVEMELPRLSPHETAVVAERVTGERLEDRDADRLHRETEGNPLFLVEALRAGWTSSRTGEQRSAPAWITPKIQSVIQSRLVRLSEQARSLVGFAATIGREFSSDLLGAAAGVAQETLVLGLDELWRHRIIREQGADSYDFSHDKIREVAYLALGPASRRHHHLRVARTLERLHGGDPAPVSGQIASHLDIASAAREAVFWYARAAEAAEAVYAYAEAIRLLERALDLLGTFPDSSERKEQELELLNAWLAPIALATGFGSSRLMEVQRRGRDLAATLGIELPAPLLRSVAIASLARGEFERAQEVGERLRRRGEREGDAVLLVEGHYVLGVSDFWQGKLQGARTHLEAAVDRYRREHRATHLARYGLDPQAICMSRLGNTLWLLGLARGGRKARDSALTLAHEVGHPPTRATVLTFAALLALDLGEIEGIRGYVDTMASFGPGQQARANEAMLDAFAAYITVVDGHGEQGIDRLRRRLDDSRRSQLAPGHSTVLARLLVEACALAGDVKTGRLACEVELASPGGARLWQPELRRRRAGFLASMGATAGEVEAELRGALEQAQRMGARALELRAATSLLGFRLKTGEAQKVKDARELLSSILAGLPEAEGTEDARRAASILALT